jgi:uncharacterized membrane protein
MDINRPIYLALIGGVIISSILFAIAFAINLLLPTYEQVAYIIAFAGAGVLILTPYLRVVVAFIAFLVNKEYKFVIISFLVLLIMMISLIMGLIFHISPKG